MKTSILRYGINHNDISLSLESGEEVWSELVESDIQALEANKTPQYGNEIEVEEGVFDCGIDGE